MLWHSRGVGVQARQQMFYPPSHLDGSIKVLFKRRWEEMGEMAQQVKIPAARLEDIGLVPGYQEES